MKTRVEILDQATIVIAEGRLDFNAATGFQKEVEQALANVGKTSNALLVDCGGLEYVSSAGLRVFMLAARNAQRANLSFAVCALQQPVREVFELSGFNRIMTVQPDRATALAQLRKAP